MDILTKNELRNLMEKRDFLCVSMYMPTYRMSPEAKQNPIRFKNLLRQMEERLVADGFRKSEAAVLSAHGKALTKDLMFWQYQSDGFAAFISSQWFRYYRLPASFKELLVITDRFHIKPLLNLFANDGRFYVLALSQNEVRLFQCSRFSVSEIKLVDVPVSLSEALKAEEPARQLQYHTKTPGGKGERTAIFHGHGSGKDYAKNKILRFFQRVDQGLQKTLGDDNAPLVLAGVEYLFPIYRDASCYPQIMQEGIMGNPEGIKPEDLQREAWRIMEPHFLQARGEAIAQYTHSRGSEGVSNDIEAIVQAAFHGRVELLFVAVDVQQWGTFDPMASSVHLHAERAPADEDLLDFAAIHTLANGGTVHAMKQEEVPDKALLAALYRY